MFRSGAEVFAGKYSLIAYRPRGSGDPAACRWLAETKAFVFIENDADFLLHRLPEEVKTAHYHDDETHIRALLEGGGLQPKGGMALAAATVRGLILTVSHQEQIGALYPQVLETLVRGACRELFE